MSREPEVSLATCGKRLFEKIMLKQGDEIVDPPGGWSEAVLGEATTGLLEKAVKGKKSAPEPL